MQLKQKAHRYQAKLNVSNAVSHIIIIIIIFTALGSKDPEC